MNTPARRLFDNERYVSAIHVLAEPWSRLSCALHHLAYVDSRGMTMRLFRPWPCFGVPMFRFRLTGLKGIRTVLDKPARHQRRTSPS
ncbi:MAG: hypothetical protein E5V73_02135 [Mesorhizobium sp.]|nr:MAG: hypothetical protein E5V73_02135 [Mesorhizobium sp.]